MSEFFARKVKTFFKRMDLNNDNLFKQSHFRVIADRFVAAGNMTAAEGDEFYNLVMEFWKVFNDVSSWTNEEMLERFKENFLTQNETAKRYLKEAYTLYFKAVDSNHDGRIELSEYETFFKILGIQPGHAKVAFEALDLNKDGVISLEEFVHGVYEFCCTDDESLPGNYFFGPLV